MKESLGISLYSFHETLFFNQFYPGMQVSLKSGQEEVSQFRGCAWHDWPIKENDMIASNFLETILIAGNPVSIETSKDRKNYTFAFFFTMKQYFSFLLLVS